MKLDIFTFCLPLFRCFVRRFAMSTKMADTKGCYRCCVVSNTHDNHMYLCAAMPSNILLMQWYEPLNKFMLRKVPTCLLSLLSALLMDVMHLLYLLQFSILVCWCYPPPLLVALWHMANYFVGPFFNPLWKLHLLSYRTTIRSYVLIIESTVE